MDFLQASRWRCRSIEFQPDVCCFRLKTILRRTLLIALLAWLDGALAAIESTGKSAGSTTDQTVDMPADAVSITVYFDNDAFSGRSHDKDYTGGIALAFSGATVASHPLSLDPVLTWLNSRSGWAVAERPDVELSSVEFGVAEPIHDDRPYVGLVASYKF